MKKILLLLLLISFCTLHAQDRKLALVIGNSKYVHSGKLKNPVNDAELMAATLKDLGFDVIKLLDANKSRMDAAILEFWRKQADYNVSLFYYAGHGVQVDGINYLIPVDAKLEDELALKIEAVDINEVVGQFNRFPNNVNIVILDACRDNPFQTWMRGGSNGFAAMQAPSGTLIAFATAPGATASDGKGENGLFTLNLVDQMKIPQRIEDVFINTRVKVRYASQGRQNPQEWSQLVGQFMFATPEPAPERNPKIGAAETVMTFGNIELLTELSGQLYLDGEAIGGVTGGTKVPIESIRSGKHTLRIEGAEVWESGITVEENKTTTIIARKTVTGEAVPLQGDSLLSSLPPGEDGAMRSSLFLPGRGQDNWVIFRAGLTDIYGVSGWMIDQGYDSLLTNLSLGGQVGLEYQRKWMGIDVCWSKKVRFLPQDISVRSTLIGFSLNGYLLGPAHSLYISAGYMFESSGHYTETDGNKEKWLRAGYGYPSLKAGYRNRMLNLVDFKVGAGTKVDIQGDWHLTFEVNLGVYLVSL
jgi:hypothetical protein